MKWEKKVMSYEAMKHERWPSAKRVLKSRTEQLLSRAEQAASYLPSWRIFKRLHRLERKMDMPFIEESGLTQYIDDAIEQRIKEFKSRPRRKSNARL